MEESGVYYSKPPMNDTLDEVPHEGQPILIADLYGGLRLVRFTKAWGTQPNTLWSQWGRDTDWSKTFSHWIPMSEDTARAAGL